MSTLKKLVALSIFTSLACGDIYNLKNGWNLLGTSSDIVVDDLNKSGIDLVWKYDLGNWSFYSPNSELSEFATSLGYAKALQIASGEGFWIKANTDINLSIATQTTQNQFAFHAGWNLCGVRESYQDITLASDLKSAVNSIWKYKNNKWYGFSSNANIQNTMNQVGVESFNTIEKNEGFWLYLDDDKDPFKETILIPTTPYLAKIINTSNNTINPLANAEIYNDANELVTSTDFYGVASLQKSGAYSLKLDGYEAVDFYVNDEGMYLVNVASLEEEPEEDSVITIEFDIGNWYEGSQNTMIEAKVIPKVFSNPSKTYSLIVNEFAANVDLTLSVLEDLTLQEEHLISSMKVVLQTSNGSSINVQASGFVGRFLPIYYNKTLDTNKQYALYFRENNTQSWNYVQMANYDAKKGRLKPIADVDKIGEYGFFGFDRLKHFSGSLKDENNTDIGMFYIKQNNNAVSVFKDGQFDLIYNDDTNVTIFADGYKSKLVAISQNTENIVLEKLVFSELSLKVNNLFGSQLPQTLDMEVEHNITNIGKKFRLELQNEHYVILNFPQELMGKEAKLEDGSVVILQNGVEITVAPKLNKLETSKNSIDYSNMIEFSEKMVNISSNGKIEWYDKTTLEKQGEKSLNLESVFDSFIVVGDKLLIGTMAGNIYSVDGNFTISEVKYSVEESFAIEVGSKFVFKPILVENEIYWITNYGDAVVTDLDGELIEEVENYENTQNNLSNLGKEFIFNNKKYLFFNDGTIDVFTADALKLGSVKIDKRITNLLQVENKFFIKTSTGDILYFLL